MSNFQCPHCGMTNIDCGWGKFKTPREIELEEKIKNLEEVTIPQLLDELKQKDYTIVKLVKDLQEVQLSSE